MNVKSKKLKSFTLIEIIVSMALFMILMMAVTRFFYAANTLWTDFGRKNMLYSDARIAMNLIATDLQNSFYEYERVPFCNNQTQYKKVLGFVTALEDKANSDCKSNLTEVQYRFFEKNPNKDKYVGELKRYTVGDMTGTPPVANTAWNFLDPAQFNGSATAATVLPAVFNITDGDPNPSFDANYKTDYNNYDMIIPNAVAFSWICYDKAGTEISGDSFFYPYSVRINLELLDSAHYKKYAGMKADGSPKADEFKNRHKRVFTREIILGDRGQ